MSGISSSQYAGFVSDWVNSNGGKTDSGGNGGSPSGYDGGTKISAAQLDLNKLYKDNKINAAEYRAEMQSSPLFRADPVRINFAQYRAEMQQPTGWSKPVREQRALDAAKEQYGKDYKQYQTEYEESAKRYNKVLADTGESAEYGSQLQLAQQAVAEAKARMEEARDYYEQLGGKVDRSVDERIDLTIRGALGQTAAGFAAAGANLYEGGTRGSKAQIQSDIADMEKQLERAQQNYNATLSKYGDENNANVKAAKVQVDNLMASIKLWQGMLENQSLENTANQLYAGVNRLSDRSAMNVEMAKQGLGAIGRGVVDVGVGGIQMLGDIALGAATGGGVLPVMAARSFGSAAMEARNSGASYERQTMYGIASAGVEVLTEKISDGIGLLKGKGSLDDVVEKAIRDWIHTDAGRTVALMLYGVAGEAAEEAISAAVEPALKMIYESDNASAKEAYSSPEGRKQLLSSVLHDAIIGGALGFVGGGSTIFRGQNAAKLSQMNVADEAQNRLMNEQGLDKKTSSTQAELIAKVLSGQELTAKEQAQLDKNWVSQDVLFGMQNEGASPNNRLYNAQTKRQDEKLAQAAAKSADSDFAAYSDGDLIKIARAAKTAKDDTLYQRVISEFERRSAEREASFAPEQRIDTTEDQSELAARLNPQLREQGDRNERPVPLETSQYDENGQPIPDYYQPERAPFSDEDVPPEFGNTLPDDQRELMQRGTNQPPVSQTQQPAPQPAPVTQPATKPSTESQPDGTIVEEGDYGGEENQALVEEANDVYNRLVDFLENGPEDANFQKAGERVLDPLTSKLLKFERDRLNPDQLRQLMEKAEAFIETYSGEKSSRTSIEEANEKYRSVIESIVRDVYAKRGNARNTLWLDGKPIAYLVTDGAGVGIRVGHDLPDSLGYNHLSGDHNYLIFYNPQAKKAEDRAPVLIDHEYNSEFEHFFVDALDQGAYVATPEENAERMKGANNGGEQTVQQPVAGAGGDAGAVGGQTLGRNADVSGGRSDSALQERGAGFGSSETNAGAGEGTGGNGSSFLSVSKAKNGADLEGDVISERDYDKDQREFAKTAYEDGFESTTIISGDSFVIDGIEANGHVDSNGNLTVANLDPEKRRCVKDHECIHLWSHAISDTERVNTLKGILLNIADRDTLNSMWTAYSKSLRDTYANLKGDAYKAKVFEEILGDMYGGINRFETNASYYRAAAQSAVKNAKMRQNYLDSTRNNALNKALDRDTRKLKTRDIKSALAYTLNRLSPDTKNKPAAERAADIMLAYYDESSDGTLNGMSKEQTKRAITAMRNLLNELGARKVSLSDFTGSTTGYEDSFGLVQDNSPAESFEGKNGNVFTRKQKNKFIDLSQEPKSDSSRTEGEKAKKTPLQADEEYLRGDYQRDIEALRKTSEWEAGGRKGKMPKDANYLKGTIPVSFDKQQGWLEHKMPSTADIDEAKKILEAKGKRATIEDQINVLKARKDYLIEIGKSMKAIRSDFYGSGDIEQRKADLSYIADGVKEQLNQLESDLGYVLDEYDLGSVGESLAGIQDILNQSDRLNVLLDAMRDEYRHLKDGDSDALRTIRSQIDAVNVEIRSLSRRLDRTVESSDDLFKASEQEYKRAKQAAEEYERTGDSEDSFWRDEYQQQAKELRHRGQKRKNRENWAKRTLAQAEAFEERQPSREKFFVEASESASEREPLSPGDQALLESHMRGGDYVPSAKEPKIRNQQTEDANRIIQGAGNISPDVQQQSDINARSFEAAKANAELDNRLAAQIREDLGLPPKPTPQRRVTDKDFKGFGRTQERRYGNIGTWMSTDAWHNTPEGKEFVRNFGEYADESFDLSEGIRQGFADRYSDDEGKVSKSRGIKDPSGFRTSRSEGSFSTADATFGKEASEFRKKLDNIVNGKGELFKAVTEADNAPLHDDLDNPKAKLTKEQREKAARRVGSKPTVKPVTQEVADAMLHLQEDVKGILESDAPLRHVLNLAESIRSYSEEDHEMNWLTKNGIAEAAQELQDIFDDKNMDNDVKARNMADATTRLLQMVSTRVDRAEANRARGLSLEQSIAENARQQKEAKTKFSKFGQKAKNWAESMQLNPTTAFKMADGFNKQKNGTGYWIAHQIENAVAREQMLTASVHGKYNALKGVEGVDDFVSGKSMAAVEVPGVGQITEQQAVEFIKMVNTLYHQRVGMDRRLDTIKGFTFIDKSGKEVTVNRKSFKSGEMSNFAEDVSRLAVDMERKLSPAAKKYLEITDEILDDLGTQVSSAMQRTLGVGMTQYHKGGYYPVKYQSQGGKKAPASSKPAGLFDQFTERTKTTGGLIRIESAADTVDSYIRNAVYAASYGELADTLEFLNTPALGLDGLSNAAGEAFGSDFKRMFNNYVRDVAGIKAEDVTGDSALLHSARQLLQQGALRFSISVPIKQVASYWNAAGVVSPEALMQAYRFKLFKDKGYGKNNLQLQYRAVGGIDPTLSEMLNNQGFLTELKKRSGIINAWDKAISTMDYRTVDDLYHACIIDAKSAFPSVDQNSKQFADIVNSLFQEAVLSTQPTFNANARSEYQRTSNEWIRMAGMFRTQQTQNFNRAVTALGEYNAAKGTILEASAKKQLRQTLTGQLAAAAEFGLLSIVAEMARHKLKPYKKDEEEQTEGNNLSLKKIGTRWALNTLESLAGNLWIGLGGADQLVKGMVDAIMHDTSDESGEYRGINLGPITSAANAFKNLQSVISTVAKAWEEKDLRQLDINALRYAATNTAQLFGIPANNVVNFVDSALTYVLDGVSEITGEKKGNRADYDSVIKMVNKAMKGELTVESAKHQANLAFNSGDAENLLYNIGILEAQGRIKAEKEGKDDPHSGADYLAGRLLGNTDEQNAATRAAEVEQYGRELTSKERIANYLVGDGLSDKQIDEAMDEYVTSGGYNVLYNALRAQGFSPKNAVNELYKSDNKTGMQTEILSEDSVESLLAGEVKPGNGTDNDIPALEQRNLDQYVDYATSLKVFIETKNYDELDKLVSGYSKLDKNTQAVLAAKDSNLMHMIEVSKLGITSADYYAVKAAEKQAQVDLDLSSKEGSPNKMVALSISGLPKNKQEALMQSEWLGISKTAKVCYDALSQYGYSIGDVGKWLLSTDFSWEKSNGTISNIEAAQGLRHLEGLTDAQRRAIYETLKPQLTNPHKINDWGRYTYDSEIAYIDKNGYTVGKWN